MKLYPVFLGADWNRFSSGSGWVKVPTTAYAHPLNDFDIVVGDTCMLVETEEMLGAWGTVVEISERTDEHGTPTHVKVRVIDVP